MSPTFSEKRRTLAHLGGTVLALLFLGSWAGCKSTALSASAPSETKPIRPVSSQPARATAPHSAAAPTRTPAPFDSPPRDFDFGRLSVELTFTPEDLLSKGMSGVVTHGLRPRREGVSAISLNAMAMRIDAVEIGNPRRPLDFRYDGKLLEVALPSPPKLNEEVPLRIAYRVENPPLGLHFVGEPADDTFAVYSNGEPLQARYWLPCHDWPDARWPGCDVRICVPYGLVGVSVGEPAAAPAPSADGTSMIFSWKLDVPIDPHLLGFAVGKYVEYVVDCANPRVSFFSQEGFEAAARQAFEDSSAALAFFSQLTGVAYPYPRFTHVVVPQHFHGGMEHAGFNMIAPHMFQGSPKADWIRFAYLAHMMAHQWFAGLVNYRHITEAWVNEGFGSYLHLLWMREKRGADAFRAEMRRVRDIVLRFDIAGKSHPMVNTEIAKPEDIYGFSGGLVYWKGAWVLHMLRAELGDALFWSGVHTYLTRHRFSDVDTSDLKAAFEQASGRELTPFFKQWVWRDGTPHVTVRWNWDSLSEKLIVNVEQTQLIDATHPAFAFPLTLEIGEDGERQRLVVQVSGAQQRFAFDQKGKPGQLRADPDLEMLANLKVEEYAVATQPASTQPAGEQ